ncbi:MAG: 4-hydroxythreonine-4-phosphate dehydrogenase PdxA [Chloroflexi bacterium]|jgi:4-hydroxythreonine-4-phosphate dehydrogenase|nr:4-hydroxythreonine-4-phosphate dehydrogenase PdxA [Chloroflexota bacterium]MDP7195098.1 4-hydroxythreonine-4-phosphate dehydrogenase PdxA [SAR202 cluster bacterium]|tara:strand:- start:1497 stop:2537 length:1041 start_codon:yes stop_codon:yes gene_type:complete
MSVKNKPIIAISMGDPCGIGAEIICKSLSEIIFEYDFQPLILGNFDALEHIDKLIKTHLKFLKIDSLSKISELNLEIIPVMDDSNLDFSKISPGVISAIAGDASMKWVLHSGRLAHSKQVAAVVSCPINKESCGLTGSKAIGHMELFQEQTESKNVATMLMTPGLRVVHLSTHKSLKKACDYVTFKNVYSKIELIHTDFKKYGFKKPKIGVSALNPHGSDGGLFGTEEKEHILPAVSKAQSEGIDVKGPIPADTIFNQAINGEYDVVLAQYHDQGHIPIKVHNWEHSVSLNLGLPFIRASVDHGTAFDIADKGIADHTSFKESIKLAIHVAANKSLPKFQYNTKDQ